MNRGFENDLAEIEILLAKEARGEALTEEERRFLEGNPEAFGWIDGFDLEEIVKDAERRLEENPMVFSVMFASASVDALRALAKKNGYQVNFDQKRDAVISDLSAEIQSAFQKFLQCAILEDGFELLSMLQLDNLSVKEELKDAFAFYLRSGFVSFVYEGEAESLSGPMLIVPVELQRIFLQSKPIQWLDQLGELDMAYNMIRGLVNLYGSYPVRQLELVWQVQMQKELPESLLQRCLQRISFEKDFVRCKGEELMAKEVYEDPEIEAKLRQKRTDKAFYMPVFHEVMAYAEMDPLAGRQELLPVQKLFKAQGIEEDELKQVMTNLYTWLMLGETGQDMVRYLSELGLLRKEGASEFALKLEPLLVEAAQSSRLWIYKGHNSNRTCENIF